MSQNPYDKKTPDNHWDYDDSAQISNLRYIYACRQRELAESAVNHQREMKALNVEQKVLQDKADKLVDENKKLTEAFGIRKYWDKEAPIFTPSLAARYSPKGNADKILEWWLNFSDCLGDWVRNYFKDELPGGINVIKMLQDDDDRFFDLHFSHRDPSMAKLVEETTAEYNEAKKFFLLSLKPKEIKLLGSKVISHLTPISFMHVNSEVLAAFSYEQARFFNSDQLIAIANLPNGYLPTNCGVSIRRQEFLQEHPEYRQSKS